MPFDRPVPMCRAAAYEVGPRNSHSVFFQFQQAGEVNLVFINRARLENSKGHRSMPFPFYHVFCSDQWSFMIDDKIFASKEQQNAKMINSV